ncbi:RHE_PE00001 family protein [Microvirga puerhi]|uniref:DUF1612 and helix-turn-helix domain-containing protein n=1 Tax=Microvirga puerhi TaxID=2876078 RepID=A0ABS7VSX5_9HYPH|nr:RHE_PE00001 family protein [Microvirga puerhi]MBZ6078663.1 DUF1612 and helix-turn-helix domain-containing protein [Microvirga puerhi]
MRTFSISDDQALAPIQLPQLPWENLVGRLESLVLDIRTFDAGLEASGLTDGWQSRCDMTEAARALMLDGQLVDLGDIVLHDAGMDVRSPTHELTRAAAALRARRTVMVRKPPWPLSIDGITALRGIASVQNDAAAPRNAAAKRVSASASDAALYDDEDPWLGHFADIDALLDRTSQVLAGEIPLAKSRSTLVYDEDEDEMTKEDLWLDVVHRTRHWPALAAAALAWDAWTNLHLHQRQPWLGLILAGAILRTRGVTSRLLPLASGYKTAKYRPTGRETPAQKIEGFCQIVSEALTHGQKDLERLSLARDLMNRVTRTCRSHSKLPDVVSLFLSRPLVTVALAAKLLQVTPKAVDLMLVQLGGALPRELTGRRRYRAWGIV